MAKAKKKAKSKAQQIKPTIKHARKVLELVDAGLVRGLGVQKPGQMCVEAAVRAAFGLSHGDNPPCVGRAVRAYKIRLNDAMWSSDQARAKGMRQVAIAQLGSDGIDQRQFADLVVVGVISQILPIRLRAIAKRNPEHAEELEKHAVACEAATDRPSARAVARAARVFLRNAAGLWWYYAAADAAAAAAARDSVLSLAAKIAVDALKVCKSQGVKWLKLAA